jgi:mRNA interferase YafQ
MRTIESTKVFRRDYKKVIATPRFREIGTFVEWIGDQLAADIPLDIRYRDHPLSGVYAGCRECHVKPDLLLVYTKPDSATLRLLRLGSHSELF